MGAAGTGALARVRRNRQSGDFSLLATLIAFVSLTMVGSALIEELAHRQRRARAARHEIHVPAE